jgi:hypothetical protein
VVGLEKVEMVMVMGDGGGGVVVVYVCVCQSIHVCGGGAIVFFGKEPSR